MIKLNQPLIGEEEMTAVAQVMQSGHLAQGQEVLEFERAFARYCGVEHAVAVASGTAALYLALKALPIEQGSEVITTPLTFIATANAIILAGHVPVFSDIDDYYCLDADLLPSRLTAKARVVLPVHLYGQVCDMGKIMNFADREKLFVIEDACQAHGAEYDGRKVGGFGIGCFSFYATKNMTTGEGGMVTTDDSWIADKVRGLRDHGRGDVYCQEAGFNFRMTDIQAVIGRVQLGKLDWFNQRRIENATLYDEMLPSDVIKPAARTGCKHVFHQYVIQARNPVERQNLLEELWENNIAAGVYYPKLVADEPHIRYKYAMDEHYPNASEAANCVLSLPCHPGLGRDEVGRVADVVREFYEVLRY